MPEGQGLSWFVFGLMASVTFIGILSELVPSGILPQMAEGLGVSEGEVGFLVGVYALASAVAAIPVVSATLAMNRKRLLLLLLVGFAVSNLVVAAASSYALIVTCRILGGICAGVMWPMIAAYGTRLVPEHMHGKAITVIMSGNTLGISIGLPATTTLGMRSGGGPASPCWDSWSWRSRCWCTSSCPRWTGRSSAGATPRSPW